MPTPPAPVRALAATALLALGLSLGTPAAAHASGTGGTGGTGGAGGGTGGARGTEPGRGTSSCPATTAQQSTRAARAVFTGTVTESVRTDTTDGVDGETYAQQVALSRVYQGGLTTDTVEVLSERQPQQCSLGQLSVGTSYVFFVVGDGSPEEPWTAQGGGGTAALEPRLVSQVERLLGAGRPPVVPSQETAEFTPVEVADPAPLARLAAPGAALMLIGVLGLLVVGRLGRRG